MFGPTPSVQEARPASSGPPEFSPVEFRNGRAAPEATWHPKCVANVTWRGVFQENRARKRGKPGNRGWRVTVIDVLNWFDALGLQSDLLTRYLDPLKTHQTPSQEVFGALGMLNVPFGPLGCIAVLGRDGELFLER